MKIKKIIGYIIYNGFAKHLPVSNSQIHLFQKKSGLFAESSCLKNAEKI